jgi:hypothetical protein
VFYVRKIRQYNKRCILLGAFCSSKDADSVEEYIGNLPSARHVKGAVIQQCIPCILLETLDSFMKEQLPMQTLKVDSLKKDRSNVKQQAQAKRSAASTELETNESPKRSTNDAVTINTQKIAQVRESIAALELELFDLLEQQSKLIGDEESIKPSSVSTQTTSSHISWWRKDSKKMTELKKLFRGKNCLWDRDFRN